jgi:hypothetical protein
MVKYKAMFVRVDGLEEFEVGNSVGLSALTQEDAAQEALSINRPEGANFVKLVKDGKVEKVIGFDL